ncbi:hypothetical protein [Rhizobium aouanii]|uniref:Uncharacterized protein n=1 Tax=Rhizobium aouanii TaxID=3118145 RepID=A0ABU8CVZ2_9HYPH
MVSAKSTKSAGTPHLVGQSLPLKIALVPSGQGTERASVSSAHNLRTSIAIALLLFNGWKGWEMVYRHRVGVSEESGNSTR